MDAVNVFILVVDDANVPNACTGFTNLLAEPAVFAANAPPAPLNTPPNAKYPTVLPAILKVPARALSSVKKDFLARSLL